MFTTIRKKLCSARGFTLVEMLCSIAVLLLATGMITLLTDVGMNAYKDSVSYSEAQTLCQTLTSIASADLRGYTYNSAENKHQIAGRGYVKAELKNGTLELYHQYDETSSMEGQVYIEVPSATEQTATHKTDSNHYDTKLALVPSASYGYGITANIDVTIPTGKDYFTLKVEVTSSDGKTLCTSTMDVKPLTGVNLSELFE